MSLGRNIEKLRIQVGLSQRDLADKMNLTVQEISLWENDLKEPTKEEIEKLCLFFRCSQERIVGENYSPKTQEVLKPDNKRHKITRGDHENKKVLIWAIIVGVALLAITIVYSVNNSLMGTFEKIIYPIVICYLTVATVYCIFSGTWVSDVFFDISTWSINFPGVMFSFDLDGFIFLIVIKLLFFVIGIFIGICAFIIALILSVIFSAFTFPFALIFNK